MIAAGVRGDSQSALRATVACVVWWASSATVLQADIVNDYGAVGYQIQAHAPIGQQFTAVDPVIHTISLGITDMNAAEYPDDHDLVIVLRQGAGFEGAVVGTAAATGLEDGLYFAWVDFTFDTQVSVRVGSWYTVEVTNETGRWAVELDGSLVDTYTGGHAWSEGKALSAKWDLRFRVFSGPRPGACCVTEGCLQDVDADTCATLFDGVHTGTGSYCADGACVTGACCNRFWGDCVELVDVECPRPRWIFWGRGVTCEEAACESVDSPCCVDGGCTDATLTECENMGGEWAGPGIDYCDDEVCPICAAGDADNDGDFDLNDFAVLQRCLGREGGADCRCVNTDHELLISLADVQVFLSLFGGP